MRRSRLRTVPDADEAAIGRLAVVLLGIGALVALVLVLGAILWISDYALEATVVDKECQSTFLGGGASSEVTVRTKVLGIEHTVQDFPNAQCAGLRAGDDGNFVQYRIRSGQTTLYEREGGPCIWDSEDGLGC